MKYRFINFPGERLFLCMTYKLIINDAVSLIGYNKDKARLMIYVNSQKR